MAGPSLLDDALRARIAKNLASYERFVSTSPELARAAVALVLVRGPAEEPCFLLTRRAASLNRHSGQFALPGGRCDEGEDAITAALRELHEELGIALPHDRALGLLDDFSTRSGYVMTPVVVWAPEVDALTPNPAEVAVTYRVPLAELYRPDAPRIFHVPYSAAPLLSLPLVGTQIYSPTAAIIYQMRELALDGRVTRVHHYEQPRFAWK